jgi:hypothetical protein
LFISLKVFCLALVLNAYSGNPEGRLCERNLRMLEYYNLFSHFQLLRYEHFNSAHFEFVVEVILDFALMYSFHLDTQGLICGSVSAGQVDSYSLNCKAETSLFRIIQRFILNCYHLSHSPRNPHLDRNPFNLICDGAAHPFIENVRDYIVIP